MHLGAGLTGADGSNTRSSRLYAAPPFLKFLVFPDVGKGTLTLLTSFHKIKKLRSYMRTTLGGGHETQGWFEVHAANPVLPFGCVDPQHARSLQLARVCVHLSPWSNVHCSKGIAPLAFCYQRRSKFVYTSKNTRQALPTCMCACDMHMIYFRSKRAPCRLMHRCNAANRPHAHGCPMLVPATTHESRPGPTSAILWKQNPDGDQGLERYGSTDATLTTSSVKGGCTDTSEV